MPLFNHCPQVRRDGLYSQQHNVDRVVGIYGERSITGGYSPEKRVDPIEPVERKGAGIKYWYLDTMTGIYGYGVESLSRKVNVSPKCVIRHLGDRFVRSPDKGPIVAMAEKIPKRKPEPRRGSGAPSTIQVRHLDTGVVYPSVNAASLALSVPKSTIRAHIDQGKSIKVRRFERVEND
jgi:hypothetical protein